MKTTEELFAEGFEEALFANAHSVLAGRSDHSCSIDHTELAVESVTACVAAWLDWIADQVGAPRSGQVLSIPLFRLPEG